LAESINRAFVPNGTGGSFRFSSFFLHSTPIGVVSCPVRGSISVESSVSYDCSAPIGAGDSSLVESINRAFVPDGTGGSSAIASFYRVFATNGASKLIYAETFYRHSATNGAKNKKNNFHKEL
jgi:hypothetical protein